MRRAYQSQSLTYCYRFQLLNTDDSSDDVIIADDTENIETIDDLREYDDVHFIDSIRRQASEKRTSGQDASIQEENSANAETDMVNNEKNTTTIQRYPGELADERELYENTQNRLYPSDMSIDELPLYNNESFDSGMSKMGRTEPDPLGESHTTVAQLPDKNNRYDGDSDADSRFNYENSAMIKALQTQTGLSTIPSSGLPGMTFEEELQTNRTPNFEEDEPSDSPPPLPNSPPPPMLGEPFSNPLTLPPDPFPRVPPRRDLITTNGGLPDLVERRSKPTSDDDRVGSGSNVVLNPRNSYFMYKDDQTNIISEDSDQFVEQGVSIDTNDLLVLNRQANGSLPGNRTAADDMMDDDNLYDSPPSTMYNY